jgi:hypothetical protein
MKEHKIDTQHSLFQQQGLFVDYTSNARRSTASAHACRSAIVDDDSTLTTGICVELTVEEAVTTVVTPATVVTTATLVGDATDGDTDATVDG